MVENNLPGISIPPRIASVEDFKQAYPVDQIRMYDDAVKKWVDTFIHPEKVDVVLYSVIATPERSYGETKNVANTEKTEQDRKKDKIITPIRPTASIVCKSIRFDKSRWKRTYINRAGFVDPNTKTEMYQFPYPKPFFFDYSIEFEAINHTTRNLLYQFFHLQFDDFRFYIQIDFRKVHPNYGCYDIAVEQNGFEDVSDLEGGEGQRNKRLVLDLQVLGWLMRPMRITKTIKKATIGICDQNGIQLEVVTDEEGTKFVCL